TDDLEHKIYQKAIEKQEMENYQSQYEIVSTKLVSGKPLVHIYSESDPGNGFQQIEANLEDVFFTKILGVG
ncbi:MAG: ABC-2 type transport system ATP-binding protein, partial [Flavobacteriales bacterium]